MNNEKSDKAWSGKTGGMRWQQQFLIWFFRYINPIVVYPFIWFWILGYILFASSTRRGIWYYWRKRQGCGRLRSAIMLYLNYLEFGKVIMDRFAAYSGRHIAVETEGMEILRELESRPEGFVVLSSHIGNQELAGYTYHPGKPMAIVLYAGDTETVNRNREQQFARMGMRVISVSPDGSHVLSMHQAISRGEILSIHGDRCFHDTRPIRAEILGEEASFPEGASRFAVAEGVPVVSMYMMREGVSRYRFKVYRLSDGTYAGASKREHVRELLESYTHILESVVEAYPLQWFHFYEFWKK